MIIESIPTGPLETNTYLVADGETKEAIVIDPGGDVGHITARLEALGVTLKAIVNTHGHFDHISGNRELKEATGAPIFVHEEDVPLFDRATATGSQAADELCAAMIPASPKPKEANPSSYWKPLVCHPMFFEVLLANTVCMTPLTKTMKPAGM